MSSQKILTTNAPLEIKYEIEKINSEYTDKHFLQRFQFIIKEFFVKNDQRGLLLYHTVGSGKTITAAAIAEEYRKVDPDRQIVILLSKTLQAGFRANVKKYIKNTAQKNTEKNIPKKSLEDEINENYKFISLNASNMYSQFTNINKTDQAIEFENLLDKFHKHLTFSNKKFLENTILIIDEVHNLCNGVKNGAKNSVQLYNAIMNTKNIKLVFLTGTPIIDTPFILVPLFNMLRGYIYIDKGKNAEKYTLFPENAKEFNEIFIDRNDKYGQKKEVKINNREIFQNRITGLVSYYGNYFFQDELQEGFPEVKPLIIEKVTMSDQQINRYMEMRSIEEKEEESSIMRRTYSTEFEVKEDKNISSYKIRSRQVSNFLIPSYALSETYVEGRPKIEKNIYKIEANDLRNLSRFSPKFAKIIENINKYPNTLKVVYSEFVHGEGIILFSRVLEAKEKYVYWQKNLDNKNMEYEESEFVISENTSSSDNKKTDNKKSQSKTLQNKKTYALIHGDVPFIERERILRAFNSKDNSTGDIISLLLISKSGAEGLSLRNVRSIHIMEPFWNYSRIEQIIARGVRYRSHDQLPESDRNIQPYLYISVLGNLSKSQQKSTDEELLRISLEGQNIKHQFELAMIESSVDCSFNKELFDIDDLECHLCLPDNKPLYDPQIANDIGFNICKPYKEKEVKLESIKLPDDDTLYYYKRDGYNIVVFEFDKSINKYIEMKKNDPRYSEITLQILQKLL